MDKPRILLINDDEALVRSITKILGAGYDLFYAEDAESALTKLFSTAIDIVILDIDIPGLLGVQLLDIIKKYNAGPENIMLYASENQDLLQDAMYYGINSFIKKPIDKKELESCINVILERRQLLQENCRMKEKIVFQQAWGSFVGKGEYYNALNNMINNYAAGSAPVLISGELGTEKEVIAYEIYSRSSRAYGPLVFKNISSPKDLEDISFLYEANNGYVVISDCAKFDAETQKRLKGLLSDNPVNVGIILLASGSLREAVAAGTFDEYLYMMLAPQELYLLPLRERKKEMPMIIDSILRGLNFQYGCSIEGVEPESLVLMSEYSWPGNYQQLLNMLKTVMFYKKTGIITQEDIPLQVLKTTYLKLEKKFEAFIIQQQ